MSITNFSAASSALTSMSAGSASTSAATTVYSNARAAIEVAKASSVGNSISASTYASAAPPHIFTQVKNMYYNYPQGGYMEPPEMSLAIKCAIGAFIVGGCATALYMRFRPEDIPPGEDPHTWSQQLEQASNFLDNAANENPLLHRDLTQAREQLMQVTQPVDHARRTERTAQEQHEDIWKSCLQCDAHDYEAQTWRNKAQRLQNELDRYPDLDQQLINMEAETARLRGVNNRLEVEKDSVEMDFDIKFVEMETQLMSEKEDVVEQLNTANEDLDDLRDQLDGVQDERDTLAGLVRSLKESNGVPSDVMNMLQLKEEEVQEVHGRLQCAKSNANGLFKQVQELQNKLDVLQKQNASQDQDAIMRDQHRDGELEEARRYADELYGSLEHQKAIMKEKEDALEEKDDALNEMDDALEQKDAALDQAQTEIAELKKINKGQKEIEELSDEELAASKQECEELQRELTTTKTERDGERNKRIEYDAKIKQLTDLLMTAVAERDHERKLREGLDEEIKDLDGIRMGLVAERDQERKKSKDLEEQIRTMKSELSAPSPIPQPSHRRLDSRQSSRRASYASDRSLKSSVSGSSQKLRISTSASHAHKSPFLDVAPSDLPVVLQAANGEETAIDAVDPSSQHHDEAPRSPASSFMGQATQNDPLIPATPAFPASQDHLTSSSSSNSLFDSTPSRKRPRATEPGHEAGPVTNDETSSSCVKRSRKIASPHNRDSPSPPSPPFVTNNNNDVGMEDIAPSISSSQVPTLDLANAPTFARPDTILASIEVQGPVPVPATPASPTRRSRLPVAGGASPTRKSARTTTTRYGTYNEAAMVRASSPEKDAEVSAPSASASAGVTASSQQSEVATRARARSPTKRTQSPSKTGGKASPKKTTGAASKKR